MRYFDDLGVRQRLDESRSFHPLEETSVSDHVTRFHKGKFFRRCELGGRVHKVLCDSKPALNHNVHAVGCVALSEEEASFRHLEDFALFGNSLEVSGSQHSKQGIAL